MFKKIFVIFGLIASLGFASVATNAYAANIFDSCNNAGSDSFVCGNKNDDVKVYLKNIVNVLLYVLGAIAVIVIILSGIFYVISAGDSNAVTKAKNTLFYAVVGLVVAILAYAIVNFVLSNIIKVSE